LRRHPELESPDPVPDRQGAGNPTREIPTALDAIATLDAARAPLRPDRIGEPHIGRGPRHVPADLGFEPAHRIRACRGDHRAPADGTIGPGDLLDRTEDHEGRQLGPAHRAEDTSCRRPALASASAMAVGTRRRTCGTRARAAAITSASASVDVEGVRCATMLAPGLVPSAGRLHAAWSINGRPAGAWRAGPGGQPNLESPDPRRRSEGVHLAWLRMMPSGMEPAGSCREPALLGGKHPQELNPDHRVVHG
jgi:hypothetical protein